MGSQSHLQSHLCFDWALWVLGFHILSEFPGVSSFAKALYVIDESFLLLASLPEFLGVPELPLSQHWYGCTAHGQSICYMLLRQNHLPVLPPDSLWYKIVHIRTNLLWWKNHTYPPFQGCLMGIIYLHSQNNNVICMSTFGQGAFCRALICTIILVSTYN